MSERETTAVVDGEALRLVMRRVPSPVTVVTAAVGEERRGITIGSFTSVSLEPPLVSFNVSRDAQMHAVITVADRFAVHLLSDRQDDLSNHFAVPDLSPHEQFGGIPHHLEPDGTPIVADVLAVLHCVPYAVYEAGDHSIVVGEVVRIDEGRDGSALLYYDRSYHTVGKAVTSNLFGPVNRSSSETP